MNLRKVVLVASLIVTSQATAATLTEMCAAAGNVVRDAIVAESLRVAFNESLEWRTALFESLPPTWKKTVLQDIERFKPDFVVGTATILKEVPRWNQQGLNGQALARERIISGLEKVNEVYAITCMKRLE